MAGVAYVDMNTLLRTAKLHLMRWTGLPSERVLLVADWFPYQRIQADQVIEIRPGDMARRALPWSDGHSRISSWLSRQVEIRVRTRLALDTAASDEIWLTHTVLGHCQLEEQVIDAFDDWVPCVGGVGLLLQPSKVLGAGKPTKKDRSPGWGDTIVMVQLDYQQRKQSTIISRV